MDKLLTCNPRERITASVALDHEYFWTDPLPADPKRYVLDPTVLRRLMYYFLLASRHMNLLMNLINGVDVISHLPVYHQMALGHIILLDIHHTMDAPLQRESRSEQVHRHPLL